MGTSTAQSITFSASPQRTSTEYIDKELEIRSYLYAACGVIVCISSTICILVFSTRELRGRYIMFLALSCGDLMNGLSFVAAGVFRNVFMYQGTYFHDVSNLQCLLQTPFAIPMLVAGQFPALMNLFISLERVLALECAGWYHRMWSASHKIYLVFAAVMLTFMFFLLAVLIDYMRPTTHSTRLCTVLKSTDIVYGTLHYILVAVTYLICFVVLAAIFNKNNKRHAPSKEDERRQKMMLAMTGISVLLVSIPCLFMVIDEWGIPRINELIIGVAYCLYGVHSGLSIIVYTIFRPDFRAQLASLFHKPMHVELEKTSSQRCIHKPPGTNQIRVLSKSQSASKLQR